MSLDQLIEIALLFLLLVSLAYATAWAGTRLSRNTGLPLWLISLGVAGASQKLRA